MSHTRIGWSKDNFEASKILLKERVFVETLKTLHQGKNLFSMQNTYDLLNKNILQSLQDIDKSSLSISREFLDTIEKHIKNLGKPFEDLVMLHRLWMIYERSLEPTHQDFNFYFYHIRKIFIYKELAWSSNKIIQLEGAREEHFITQSSSSDEYKERKANYLTLHPMYHEDTLALYTNDVCNGTIFWYCTPELRRKIKDFQESNNCMND